MLSFGIVAANNPTNIALALLSKKPKKNAK
jgi:hypothetical protein